MAREARTIFLARRSYRRRRLMDLARLMPFAAAVLFLLPVAWGGTLSTASGMIYIFGAWGALIVFAALLSGPVGRAEADPEATGANDDGGQEDL